MYDFKLKVEGMHCGMCEAHVNDAVRKAAPDAKKVTSSASKGETTFSAEEDCLEAVKAAIEEMGYRVLSAETLPHEKKGFFARLFKK